MKTSLRNQDGFTLIEIMVVIVIITLLSVLSFVALSQVQKASRDTQRKSDLAGVAAALQRYYSDNASYPTSDPSGLISYNTASCGVINPSAVVWGTGNIVCNSKTYLKQLPADPLGSTNYCYSSNAPYQTYVLYAHLEKGPSNTLSCGGGSNAYNYSLKPTD